MKKTVQERIRYALAYERDRNDTNDIGHQYHDEYII